MPHIGENAVSKDLVVSTPAAAQLRPQIANNGATEPEAGSEAALAAPLRLPFSLRVSHPR